MKGFKGFNKDLQCTPDGKVFQYEIGKEYEHTGIVSTCSEGFHFCENPLDVFGYYPPSDSRYCEVEGDGNIDKGSDKVACSKIKIGLEIGLKGLIEAGLKFVFEKVDWRKESTTTGYQSGAQATGYQSGAQATGDQSGAQATGYQSGAQATGYRSMACVNGDESTASVAGRESIACALGKDCKAKGELGNWLVLVERGDWDGDTYPILAIVSIKIDGEAIKADTWYQLKDGEIIEVE